MEDLMDYSLRRVLEEIIEPGGGDQPKGEIIDPNDPEKKSKDKKKYEPEASRMKVFDSGNVKTWMPGGNS